MSLAEKPTFPKQREKLRKIGFVRVDGLRIGDSNELATPYFKGGDVTINHQKIMTLPNGEIWVASFNEVVSHREEWSAICKELGVTRRGCPDSPLIPSGYCQGINEYDLEQRRLDPDYKGIFTVAKRGDVVTVINDEWNLCGRQGKVVCVNKNGTFRVKFEPEYLEPEGIFFPSGEKKAVLLTLRPEEIRVDKGGYALEIRAKIMFGRNFHSLASPQMPFSTRNECMIEGCPKKAARRVLVNYIGTIFEIDGCKRHAKEYGGITTECLPLKS